MRKTKKILALALSAAMALSLLAGCGGDKPANNPGSANTPAAPTIPAAPARPPAAAKPAGYTG